MTSDGDGDFGVDDVLADQLVGEALGNKAIVVRLAQERSDPLEGFDEAGKVRVVVTAGDFLGRDLDVVASGELDGRLRANRALEVKMELGLREGIEDGRSSRRLSHGLGSIAKAIEDARR